jgi:hypothetical protein
MERLETLKVTAKVVFGTDPEVFVRDIDGGQVVGSERFLPPEGLALKPSLTLFQHDKNEVIRVTRDGVQVELHPPATESRQWLCQEVATAMNLLVTHLKQGQRYRLHFRQVVEVSRSELDNLSKESRQLGCQPSYNWYEPLRDLGVDPATYTKRSAAGHLHFGLPKELLGYRDQLPPLFDILIGNTSVLLDRDPDARVRREVYGRAGEFRLPDYGIEYRTPSNFWFRSSKLLSLLLGLGRMAVFCLDTQMSEEWDAVDALLDEVNIGDIQKAINESDAQLARENFKGVERFLTKHVPFNIEAGLSADRLAEFRFFLQRIEQVGIGYWFPEDPVTHWTTFHYQSGGWEGWLASHVHAWMKTVGPVYPPKVSE